MTDEPLSADDMPDTDDGREGVDGTSADETSADRDETGSGGRQNKGSDEQPWGPGEQRYSDTPEQGSRPDFGRDGSTPARPPQ